LPEVPQPVLEQGTDQAGEGIIMPKKGFKLTEESKRKISESNKGKTKGIPKSEEHKRKISEANMGKKGKVVYTPELRAKLSVAQKARIRKPWDEETKRKLSEALKGRLMHPFTEETRRKLSEARKGIILSEETRKKISEVQIGRKKPLESKIRLSCSLRGIPREDFDGFITQENYCDKFNPPFKERVREFFGRVCVECGKTEKENKYKLCVHHVNYHKDACCNENVKLLFVPLCVSCHAKTHYKRQYWEERFTKIINEKYGGKCYFPKTTSI
jgi:hypothetical protein